MTCPARHTHPKPAGFTLVEVMVVLFVIGLVAGAVALSLPPSRTSLGDEAARLAARLSRASEESVLRGEAVGLRIDRDGYAFWVRRRGQWLAMSDAPFGPQTWTPGTRATLERTGGVFALEVTDDAGPQATPPPIRFRPTGTATPFTLRLDRGEARVFVAGTAIADVRIHKTRPRGDG